MELISVSALMKIFILLAVKLGLSKVVFIFLIWIGNKRYELLISYIVKKKLINDHAWPAFNIHQISYFSHWLDI